ncbi:MAG: hypothetical protein R3A10_08290 [Caldilineaceae bacterium]
MWVCLGDPTKPRRPSPNGNWPTIGSCSAVLTAAGERAAHHREFLDIAHFPFVHEGILGVKDRPEIADYEADITPDGVEARGVQVYQPDPYGTGQGDTVRYTYRAYRPLTAYLRKESDGPQFSILLTILPHSPVDSTAWMWMAMNYGHDIPAEELIAWQDEIFAQDRPIVQSQRPELLPWTCRRNSTCAATARPSPTASG